MSRSDDIEGILYEGGPGLKTIDWIMQRLPEQPPGKTPTNSVRSPLNTEIRVKGPLARFVRPDHDYDLAPWRRAELDKIANGNGKRDESLSDALDMVWGVVKPYVLRMTNGQMTTGQKKAPRKKRRNSKRKRKTWSQFEIALIILSRADGSMSCKEIVALARADGIWDYDVKTPEQSLYAAIIRHIKSGDRPLIKKTAPAKFRITRAGLAKARTLRIDTRP